MGKVGVVASFFKDEADEDGLARWDGPSGAGGRAKAPAAEDGVGSGGIEVIPSRASGYGGGGDEAIGVDRCGNQDFSLGPIATRGHGVGRVRGEERAGAGSDRGDRGGRGIACRWAVRWVLLRWILCRCRGLSFGWIGGDFLGLGCRGRVWISMRRDDGLRFGWVVWGFRLHDRRWLAQGRGRGFFMLWGQRRWRRRGFRRGGRRLEMEGGDDQGRSDGWGVGQCGQEEKQHRTVYGDGRREANG